MCVSCGCGLIHDDHGDPRNITIEDLRAAADAANESVACAGHNIESVALHQFPEAKKAQPEIRGVLKSRDEDHFLLTVVYSPHRMPLRGADGKTDLASPRVLEKACWRFMAKGARSGMWHEAGHEAEATCVENYMYRNPVPWIVEHPDGSRTVVKEGTWLAGFILSDRAWAEYKAGRLGGVSMQGDAGRMAPSAESLARVKGGDA